MNGVQDVEDPYEVLGVGRDADPATITEAYRRLVREHHPDIHVDDDADQRARRHQQMASINAAYRILNDPRELDRFLKMQQRRPNGAATASDDHDGTSFAAGPPPRSGRQDPPPDAGFDYRQRAPSEFDVRREAAEERATRKAQRRFGRRWRRP
jgi:curved DNA-binding protein CbpA